MSNLTIGLLIGFAIAQLADVATTSRALRRGAREGNPIIGWAMRHLGPYGWVAAKLVAAGALASFLVAGGHVAGLAVATTLSMAIALWNARF